ncbi:MAG: hypothetical protein MAG451_02626 [Anaerolineales bacterium]|nr:hypothetical protein [Anaerolineales bacterium]
MDVEPRCETAGVGVHDGHVIGKPAEHGVEFAHLGAGEAGVRASDAQVRRRRALSHAHDVDSYRLAVLGGQSEEVVALAEGQVEAPPLVVVVRHRAEQPLTELVSDADHVPFVVLDLDLREGVEDGGPGAGRHLGIAEHPGRAWLDDARALDLERANRLGSAGAGFAPDHQDCACEVASHILDLNHRLAGRFGADG